MSIKMSNNPKFTFSNDHFFHCGTRGGWELLVGLLWDPWWVGTLGWTLVGTIILLCIYIGINVPAHMKWQFYGIFYVLFLLWCRKKSYIMHYCLDSACCKIYYYSKCYIMAFFSVLMFYEI